MAEDFAIVHTKAIANSNSETIVNAVVSCINAATSGYWEVDTSVTVSSGQAALKAKPQGYGNADSQRIAIRSQASGVVQFGYAPSGWSVTSLDQLDTSPPAAWSGWRNITGTATGVTGTTRVWVAQYRDEYSLTRLNPASSMTVLVGTAVLLSAGAHVGRVIALDNDDDEMLGLYGDALMVGALSDHAVTSSWLRGNNASNPANASVIRTGNTWWHYTRVADDPTVPALADVGGKRRLVPYCIYGHGRAKPFPDAVTPAGIMGQCKYIREHRQALGFAQRLRSTSSSDQVWRPAVIASGGTSNQFILWGSETEVP